MKTSKPATISAPMEHGVWGQRIREYRLALKWSQGELGDHCNPQIAASTISAIESGANTTTDTLLRIADALGVPIWILFTQKRMPPALFSDAQMDRIVETVIADLCKEAELSLRRALRRLHRND